MIWIIITQAVRYGLTLPIEAGRIFCIYASMDLKNTFSGRAVAMTNRRKKRSEGTGRNPGYIPG